MGRKSEYFEKLTRELAEKFSPGEGALRQDKAADAERASGPLTVAA